MTEVKANRSQIVRDYVNSVTPKQRAPLAVVAALKERGITVSASLVSYVKHNMKKKRKSGVSSKSVGKKKIEVDFDVKSCLIAKNLLASVGGDLQAAKKNLEVVSKLLS
jgi:hypothetical protein